LRYLKALLEKVFILKKKKTSERNVSILLLSRQRQLKIESPLQKNKGVVQNSNLEQRPKEFKKGFEIYRVIQKFKRTVELLLKLYCDRTKYIKFDCHFIEKKLESKIICSP
jgi:hypothetical protein